MLSASLQRGLRASSRHFSSLRSSPRDARNRRPGIPVNATRNSKALLQKYDIQPEPPANNSLLSPVHIPEDPNCKITSAHDAASILSNSAIVVQRQLELANILVGFEQSNKYVIMDPTGNHIGYMAEEESSITKALARQFFHTHRAFTCYVFDKHEKEVLRFQRPFAWINSRIRVYDPVDPGARASWASAGNSGAAPPGRIIGEAQQQWHLLRRKYNLFLHAANPTGESRDDTFSQFAYIDEPFLSWDFSLLTENNELIGSVNRNFSGFAREIFTDTGVYALRMDAAAVKTQTGEQYQQSSSPALQETGHEARGIGQVAAGRGMTLDERAVCLATAVSIDFDYFSRHSGSHGGIMPFGFFGGSEHNAGSSPGADGVPGPAGGPMVDGQEVSGTPQQQQQQLEEGPYSERPGPAESPSPFGRDSQDADEGGSWWPFDDEEED